MYESTIYDPHNPDVLSPAVAAFPQESLQQLPSGHFVTVDVGSQENFGGRGRSIGHLIRQLDGSEHGISDDRDDVHHGDNSDDGDGDNAAEARCHRGDDEHITS